MKEPAVQVGSQPQTLNTKFEEEKESLKQSLLRARKNAAHDQFLEELRAKAKVETNQVLLSYGV